MYDVINFIFLMSTNKSISYILCNKDIIVNLYKLRFLSSHFYFQPNKWVFHPPTFPPLQPNTHEEKLRICLVTVFSLIFCFQKQFFTFEIKKLVWQLKMDRKQKLFSKFNLWKKLKTCKMLFSVSIFQKSIKTRI